MKVTEIFNYLNKIGLADQIHLRNNNQIVFYHWNRAMSELIPSLTLQDNRVEKYYYSRSFIPKLYTLGATFIENDLKNEEFIRDYRG